ncbi:MAG: nitroreductase family protein [Prolixibacteraceae bacterium]|nr:nitroreductase family protein [Prolixibacteraceae bacterium]
MPKIKLDNCIFCMKCVQDCPSDSIDIQTGIIASTCIHCGHCVAICPQSTIFPDVDTIHPLNASTITPEEFETLSAGLRSCRNYQKKEVPIELLMSLVENIKHYPSASNKRPLKITIVNTPGNVQKLNDRTYNLLKKTVDLAISPVISAFIRAFVPSIDIRELQQYKKRLLEKEKTNHSIICHSAPAVLLFHGPVSKYSMSEADANIWATYTSLYAKTLGLGTCFIGFIVKAFERNKKLRKDFSLPKNHTVFAALTVGYPNVKYKNETSREKPQIFIM